MNVQLSVVCPFFNEEAILNKAIETMLLNLGKFDFEWELIVVNDGSTDSSLSIAEQYASKEDRLKIVTYPVNQGRGFALKSGIDAARGDIIVTTEIDCSWGEDVIERLYNKLRSDQRLAFVIASPNLPSGGYKNVPLKRVWLSRIGNKIIRAFFTNTITMNTGMTRAYRRRIIQDIDFDERGKEFHLEVLFKLLALGYKTDEVPAVLEWKDSKLAKAGSIQRKSSSKIKQLIRSHLRFAIFANPLKYFWALSMTCAFAGFSLIIYAAVRMAIGQVAIYVALTGLLLLLFGLIFLGFGIITAQNIYTMKELWKRR